jgi:choline dehydrogenase
MSGTCAMGPSNDPKKNALESKCKVNGVKNLRVVDCSVFPAPYIHGSNTSRGAYVVGEVVSDFIINGN